MLSCLELSGSDGPRGTEGAGTRPSSSVLNQIPLTITIISLSLSEVVKQAKSVSLVCLARPPAHAHVRQTLINQFGGNLGHHLLPLVVRGLSQPLPSDGLLALLFLSGYLSIYQVLRRPTTVNGRYLGSSLWDFIHYNGYYISRSEISDFTIVYVCY